MGSLCLYRQQRGLLIFFRSAGLQLTLVLLFCSIALSRDLYAQEPLDRKVAVSLKSVTLEKALTELENAAHVKFVYSRSRVKVNVLVTVDATDKKLSDILKELLQPRGIDFSASTVKEQILLYLHADGPPKTGELNQPVPDNQQQPSQAFRADITGTVLDATTQQPLPGVNVIVRGTTNGTSTNAEGKYSVTATDNDILVFSFIGYKPFETSIAGRILIDVSLESDVTALKEVVINAGYYDVKEKEKTGSISKVTSEVIERQPVTNPLGALQGRMPGVFIQQTTGIPGGDFNIQIRGRNSLRVEGNDPLYIVDGVPFSSEKVSSRYSSSNVHLLGASPLTSINPSDIESIEILKDADATSIYGSRGANGVVLITTKKGKAGKTKLNVDFYSGIGKARTIPLLNTQQYLTMRREAFANDGYTAYPVEAYDINGTWDTTRYTNWQKKLIGGSANISNVQASISGGSDNTQFILGAGYRKESSVFPGNSFYQKASAHLSVNHSSTNKKFSINFTASGTVDKNDQVNQDFTDLARKTIPNAPKLYNEDGSLNWESSTWTNPLGVLENSYLANVNSLISNVQVGYEIVAGLRIKASLGINNIISDEFTKYPSTAYDPAFGFTSVTRSSVVSSGGRTQSWIAEPQISYDKKIYQGQLSFLLGTTFQSQRFSRESNLYQSFPSNALLDNLPSAATTIPFEFIKSLYKYTAVFGRLNYNWKSKYMVNFTVRKDGSSRFGPGKQFATFGAVGAAWVFSNESFIQNSFRVLSFGKLRASFGSTGSDQIGNYRFLDTYSTSLSTITQYDGVTGLVPTSLYNPDFAWEINQKLEAALELGFLNDRITLSTGFYRNRSSNQLVNYTLPMTTGFTGVLANLNATVQNTGFEFEITSSNIKSEKVSWTTTLNITVPRNKLIAFPNIEASSYADTYVVGKSIYIKKLYESTGIDPESGLYTFRDFNGDGIISTPDDNKKEVFVGQEFFGGFGNTISCNSLTLDVFFQFVKQTGFSPAPSLGNNLNYPAFFLEKKPWRKPGDVAEIQRYATEYNVDATNALLRYQNSEASVANASFIRLKNISLSYLIPKKWVKGTTCKVYVQGQNLFVITGFKGLDPETQYSYTLAPLRMIMAGLQLSF